MLTARLTLDASVPALEADLLDLTSGDSLDVIITVFGFLPTDVPTSAVFTAKVSPSDADIAPTTVQKTIAPSQTAESGIRTVPLSPTIYQAHFLLSPTDTAKLVGCTVYSIRVFITRLVNGVGLSYDRTVLRGTLSAAIGSTGVTAIFTGAAAFVAGARAFLAHDDELEWVRANNPSGGGANLVLFSPRYNLT